MINHQDSTDSIRCAEASCSSQILTAQAVADDMGVGVAARTGVQLWADCHLHNSERDVHRTMKKQKTKLDIPTEIIDANGVNIPWISPESWLRFSVRKGLWPIMAGCDRHDYDGACRNWKEFWRVYEKINPDFELFQMSDVDLAHTAAWLVHGDEGRTLKKGGLMVTSLQSALGRGYDEKRVRKTAGKKLEVNFAGHTFTTRYVLHTIPKTSYESNPELFHTAMEYVAKSCNKLLQQGVVDEMRGGITYRVVILGVKGDAPYLTKVAHFYRSYNTTAKRGEERGPPKGVCPYCLAGTRSFPCEEIASENPKWTSTVGVKLPWVRTPSLIKHLPHNRGDPASFFKSDIWHVVHLGFGRSWVASVVQTILPFLPCNNLDEKWEYLTADYLEWCASQRRQAHISKITAYLMSYGDASGAMGNWHKGALTSNFMKWLVDFLEKLLPQDAEGLISQCRAATYRMNALFTVLYRAGAFLTEPECEFVSEQGLQFLCTYSALAMTMFRASRQWCFPLYPKLHIFHHLMIELQVNGRNVQTSVNPMLYCCQMDEDCVGRSSRLSRRVSIRQVAQRSLDRFLVAAYAAYSKAGLLQ